MHRLTVKPQHTLRAAMRNAAMVFLLVMALSSTGCMSIGGEDHRDVKAHTLGKELEDLKAAHDHGAISDPEFERAKAKLLAAPRQPNLQLQSL